jgi:DNA-binding HxlR family transcriptional regulator
MEKLQEPLVDIAQCSLLVALEVMGERWSFMILRAAFNGISHFEEFLSQLGIARNILSNRLSRLVDHGILERIPCCDDRRRVEYRLTPKGSICCRPCWRCASGAKSGAKARPATRCCAMPAMASRSRRSCCAPTTAARSARRTWPGATARISLRRRSAALADAETWGTSAGREVRNGPKVFGAGSPVETATLPRQPHGGLRVRQALV